MSADFDVRGAYAAGRTVFMGVELLVAPGALVPRRETELLGRTAVATLLGMPWQSLRVIDMCCGAGNLACAVALQIPHARVWAADLTADCIDVTQRNLERHALDQRVSVHQGDLFGALAELGLEGTIHAIVCNPPYISEKRLEADRAHLLQHEPREAFAAGPYGLAIHMRMVRDALPYLESGGALLFEVGAGQDRQVEILFERTKGYENVRIVRNHAGEGRVVLGMKRQ